MAAARARRLDEFTATALIFVLLFTGLVCEGYLTYVEIWVLDAICAWCVTFAAVLGFAAILEAIHLLQIDRSDRGSLEPGPFEDHIIGSDVSARRCRGQQIVFELPARLRSSSATSTNQIRPD